MMEKQLVDTLRQKDHFKHMYELKNAECKTLRAQLVGQVPNVVDVTSGDEKDALIAELTANIKQLTQFRQQIKCPKVDVKPDMRIPGLSDSVEKMLETQTDTGNDAAQAMLNEFLKDDTHRKSNLLQWLSHEYEIGLKLPNSST